MKLFAWCMFNSVWFILFGVGEFLDQTWSVWVLYTMLAILSLDYLALNIPKVRYDAMRRGRSVSPALAYTWASALLVLFVVYGWHLAAIILVALETIDWFVYDADWDLKPEFENKGSEKRPYWKD